MKIYTKKGDKGETSLFRGVRVSKASDLVEAYGTVDELNTVVGMATPLDTTDYTKELVNVIQNTLFVLGSDLATPLDKKERIDRIDEPDIEYLEKAIDYMETTLPPLKHFILPGGTQAAAVFHHARTVCRRAERAVVRCSYDTEISEFPVKYLNRLSDFFFVLARYENHQQGVADIEWAPEKKQ